MYLAALSPVRATLAGALALSLVVVGATPATAAEPNTITVVSEPSVLTLPAGDGVRDVASLSFTSALDAEVKVELWAQDAVLPALELTTSAAAGAATAVDLTLTGALAAGTYAVLLTDAVDSTVQAQTSLVVGSGRVVTVTLGGTTPTQLYPHADGVRDAVSTTITAADETGLPVAAAGSMRLVVGSTQKSVAVTVPAAPTAKSLTVTGLPLGSGSLSVALRAVSTPSAPAVRSLAVGVALKATAITAVGLSLGSTQVYPSRDGYRDSVSIKSTVSATGVPFSFPITGRIQVKYGSKVVASWSLTALGSRSVSWNGLNDGRVVPGTYSVVVSAKGPQGSTLTRTASIYVSAKKITTVRSSITYSAASILDGYVEYSWSGQGGCYDDGGAVICEAWGAYYNDTDDVATATFGSAGVPTAIRNATQFGAPRVRVTVATSDIATYFGGDEAYGGVVTANDAESVQLAVGSRTTPWASMSPGQSSVDVGMILYGYIDLRVTSFTVGYEYKVLK